jgi:hypothetical protein
MKTNSKAEAQFDQEYSDSPTFGSRFDTADLTERVRVNHQTLSGPLVFTTPASNFVGILRPDWLNGPDQTAVVHQVRNEEKETMNLPEFLQCLIKRMLYPVRATAKKSGK